MKTKHCCVGIQDHGKTSATASLGMITLWDVEGGLPQIDKYLYSRDNHVVAGMVIISLAAFVTLLTFVLEIMEFMAAAARIITFGTAFSQSARCVKCEKVVFYVLLLCTASH